MANVTDPLARAVHGTNPQNLIEYITRQKIYDTRYWKEECFGLTAVDVAEKGSKLKAVGGSYGGNHQPTRFLCLVLKMLQIQPDDAIIEELVSNEDFKYVRALGAFYLRLTAGRPADIYDKLEPLYHDYRKLRMRNPTEWSLLHVDEFVDDLLTQERVLGIAMPRLPKRGPLEEAGYLDGPRRSSALQAVLEEERVGAEDYLVKLTQDGNAAAKKALEEREAAKERRDAKRRVLAQAGTGAAAHTDRGTQPLETRDGSTIRVEEEWGRSRSRSRDRQDVADDRRHDGRGYPKGDSRDYGYRRDSRQGDRARRRDGRHEDRDAERSRSRDERRRERKEKKRDKKKYGNLFKSSKSSRSDEPHPSHAADKSNDAAANPPREEGSEEYWNEQRAKLGLKPLRK